MTEINLEDIIIKISEDEKLSEISSLFTEKRIYTFIVGAGISMDPPSCVPSARMFVSELFKYYAPEEEIENLIKLDSLRYEFLVEKVQDLFDKEIKFLDYLDNVKEPNANHIFLANMIMKYNYVVTTNFDFLLEMALKKKLAVYPLFHSHHKKVTIIITKDDYEKDVNFQFPIIKIHGSKWDCIKGRLTKDSLITTIHALGKEREKGKTFAIEPYKKKLIDKLMESRDLVVLGYSGSDDFDISPMLRELSGLKRIIWIDHDQNSGVEEIYRYKLIEVSMVPDLNLPKLDLFLVELASRLNIEVFKIKTNTINFVRNKLGPIYGEKFASLEENLDKKVPSFSDFMKENHFEASHSSKYRLAHDIYNDLGEIDHAERNALKGLESAKAEDNHINEIYFTNAIGLLALDKGETDKALDHFDKTLQLCEKFDKLDEKIGVLINIGEYYRRRSDLKNALKYIMDASELTTDDTPNLLKFSILNSLGVIYRTKGDVQNALKHIEMALETAEKMGDLSRKALCYNNLAGIYFSQGKLESSLKNATEALKIDELLGDLDNMASNLNTIGNVYRIAGDYDQALSNLNRAYQVADKIKNLRIKALAGNAIGVIYFDQGKFDMAMNIYNESYKFRKELDDLSGQATSLNNIGMVYRAKRNYQKADELFTQSIEITEKIGEKTNLGSRYANRGSIYEAEREFGKALEEYQKAISIERSLHNLHGVATQLFNAGGVLGDLGRVDECIKDYSEALNIMENLNIKPGIAQGLNNLGLVSYKFKKDYDKAIPLLERSVKIYKELNNIQMMSSTLQNLEFIKRQRDSQK